MKSPTDSVGSKIVLQVGSKTVSGLEEPIVLGDYWTLSEISGERRDSNVFFGKAQATGTRTSSVRKIILEWEAVYESNSWTLKNMRYRRDPGAKFFLENDINSCFRKVLVKWLNEHTECSDKSAPVQHGVALKPKSGTQRKIDRRPAIVLSAKNAALHSDPNPAVPQASAVPRAEPRDSNDTQVKPSASPKPQEVSAETVRARPALAYIPVDRIRPNPNQPRLIFSQSEMEAVKKSMAQEGQNTMIDVIAITDDPNADYEIVKGERRWRGAQDLGWKEIGAIILTKAQIPNKQKQHRWCFVGDFHHARYNKIETALALMSELEAGASMRELSGICGRSIAWVSNNLRLNKLVPELFKLLDPRLPRDKQLPGTIAWRIASAPKDKQMEIYEKVMKISGAHLRIREANRLLAEIMPRPLGRPRKPADNVRAILVAVPRLLADSLKVTGYPDSTFDNLVTYKDPAEVDMMLDHADRAVEKLKLFTARVAKARKAREAQHNEKGVTAS